MVNQIIYKCTFCQEQLIILGKCHVCNKCKTVARINNITNLVIISNINNTINSIQKHLNDNEKLLNNILQKQILDKKISKQENDIYEFCLEFITCRNTLKVYIQKNDNLNDLSFRKELYKLLELSLKFEKIFNSHCVELHI